MSHNVCLSCARPKASCSAAGNSISICYSTTHKSSLPCLQTKLESYAAPADTKGGRAACAQPAHPPGLQRILPLFTAIALHSHMAPLSPQQPPVDLADDLTRSKQQPEVGMRRRVVVSILASSTSSMETGATLKGLFLHVICTQPRAPTDGWWRMKRDGRVSDTLQYSLIISPTALTRQHSSAEKLRSLPGFEMRVEFPEFPG